MLKTKQNKTKKQKNNNESETLSVLAPIKKIAVQEYEKFRKGEERLK